MATAPRHALLDTQVSLFQGSYDTTVCTLLPLSTILEQIQDGTYRAVTSTLRALLEDKAEYRRAKEQSLAFTPCCALRTRDKDTPWDEKLIACTGLVHLDLDEIDDPETLKAALTQHPAVAFAFVSPSGMGLKIGIAATGIDGPESYKHAWAVVVEAIQQAYPGVHVNVDQHVKFLHALCYVSDDPALYRNPAAVPMGISPARPAPPRPPRRPLDDTQDYARIMQALYCIPTYDDRVVWREMGMALHSTGAPWARDTWDRWSQQSDKYDSHEQDRQWGGFHADGQITIATLFHHAQTHGFRPLRTRLPAPALTQAATAEAHQHPNGETAGPPDTDPPLPYSDYTNALAFVRDHGPTLRYCYPWHAWLVWTGTHWQRDMSGEVMRLAKQTVKRLARRVEAMDEKPQIAALMAHIKTSLSTSKLKAMIENAQSEPGIAVQPEHLDTDPWLLNVANGTLDLKTGQLRDHAREDLLTVVLPAAYDATAACPTWDAFLHRIMAGNQNLIAFLQRAIGYTLTGVIREHVLLILYGTGRNGKSTFLNLLQRLLGAYAMKAPSELLMVSNNDRHPTERADLFGKRFVSAIETEQGRKLAEVFVKEATGGDNIRARRMREDFWEFQPTHKVFLATNHKPVISGTDTAIWERIRLVPFAVTIPEGERDTTLPEKLDHELPGILTWALQGCRAWQQEGLGEPDEVKHATAGYRMEMDVLGQFITECCLVGPNYRTKASDLYEAYQHWCHAQGEPAEVQRSWGMRLTERGYDSGKVQGRSWWKGIALLQVDEEVDHRLPTQRAEKKGVSPKKDEQVDEGRPENGIRLSKKSPRVANAVSSSTSSTSSTYCPGCARPSTWLLRKGREVCYKCGTQKTP